MRNTRTPQSIALGVELRALRTLHGLGQRTIANALQVGQSTVQRTEVGDQLLPRTQVQMWLNLVEATPAQADVVFALLENAHNASSTWKTLQAGEPVAHLQGIAARRDATSRLIRSYQTAWLPGLLQTAEYARRLFPLVDATGEMDVAAAVAARLERQQILFRGECRFEFLVTEGAARWEPWPGVIAGQRDRLASVAGLDGVELRVLPGDVHGPPGWHTFDFREPSDGGPAYVTLELVHGPLVVSDPGSVELYREVWDRLWGSANPWGDLQDVGA